ncbi:MAG: MlaE family lipid ABC transporter permease subunit [Pseudomonadota bacterium]
MNNNREIDFSLEDESGVPVLTVLGDWTVDSVGAVDSRLRNMPETTDAPVLDVSRLGRLDTAGAYVIDRALRRDCQEVKPLKLRGEHAIAAELIQHVRDAREDCPHDTTSVFGVMDLLERLGRGVLSGLNEGIETLAFLGRTLSTCVRVLASPRRLRATSTVAIMEEAGLDAIPIVVFLTFFVGMVVAFIGASTLEMFGATIFVVELVGISVFREFGVILTAIILAGRTNSAFTAQIGAMRMRQEVDAMRVLGLDPIEVLVVPRVFAMLIMTPILAFFATLAGVAGGMVVGWLALDIPPILFANRLLEMVPMTNFWVGLSKAPLFALVVALIGCRQGLKVGGSVQSLGASTTSSVVQAIFTIIVIDACAALFFMEMDW